MLEDWVTLTDAARELSIFYQKEIKEDFLLKYALYGDLKLSINTRFTNIAAKHCPVIYSGTDGPQKEIYIYIKNIGMVSKSNRVIFLQNDIYEFLVAAAGYSYIQRLLLKPSSIFSPGQIIPICGFFIIDSLGNVYELQEFFLFNDFGIINGEFITNPNLVLDSYQTAFNLPENILLGVRDIDLFELVNKLNQKKIYREKYFNDHSNIIANNKPNKTNEIEISSEEKILAKLIFKFAEDYYGYSCHKKQNKVHVQISNLAELFDLSITDDTVRRCIEKGAMLEKSEKYQYPSRKSFLIIFYIMARDHYSYNPHMGENQIYEDIKDDAESLSICISSKLIKKWLNEGDALRNLK